jgi:sulfate adenylyltransferase subunit 1
MYRYSLTESKVTTFTFDKQFDEVSRFFYYIELENDINVTRGDMIVKSSELPKGERYQYNSLLDGQ